MWFHTNIQECLLFVKSVTRLLPKTPSKITKVPYIYYLITCCGRAETHLVPNAFGPRTFGPPHLVPNSSVLLDKQSPTNSVPNQFGPQKFGPPGQTVPSQFGPQPIWSPANLVPSQFGPQPIWSPIIWSPWTNGPENI